MRAPTSAALLVICLLAAPASLRAQDFQAGAAAAKAGDYAAALANSLAQRDPSGARRKACSALAKDWSLLGRNVRAQLRRLAPVETDAAASTRVVPGTPTP